MHADSQRGKEENSVAKHDHQLQVEDEPPWEPSNWRTSYSWHTQNRSSQMEWRKRLRFEDETGAGKSASQSWGQSGWKSDQVQSSDGRWTAGSRWENCSWRQSKPARRPAWLPEDDTRFAEEKQSRIYVCNNCGSWNKFQTRSMPFDGQYLQLLSIRGRSPQALQQAYEDGEVDATWYCTRCHQRHDESYEKTRRRIQVYEWQRIERTTAMLNQGFQLHR